MPKFLQWHRQSGAPRKRSVRSVNDHSAIVDIFRKFYENIPCMTIITSFSQLSHKLINHSTMTNSFDPETQHHISKMEAKSTSLKKASASL